MKGDEIVRPCNRHSNETVTQETRYQIKNKRKWMIEFGLKISCIIARGIKIITAELTRFLSPNKSI